MSTFPPVSQSITCHALYITFLRRNKRLLPSKLMSKCVHVIIFENINISICRATLMAYWATQSDLASCLCFPRVLSVLHTVEFCTHNIVTALARPRKHLHKVSSSKYVLLSPTTKDVSPYCQLAHVMANMSIVTWPPLLSKVITQAYLA